MERMCGNNWNFGFRKASELFNARNADAQQKKQTLNDYNTTKTMTWIAGHFC